NGGLFAVVLAVDAVEYLVVDQDLDVEDIFFQAEDGIRVFHVTGVQTCALPIYSFSVCSSEGVATNTHDETAWNQRTNFIPALRRSEERRVGKECRSGKAHSELGFVEKGQVVQLGLVIVGQ